MPLRHALRQHGVEDQAARRRQHEAGIVAATRSPSIAAPAFGKLLRRAQHLFEIARLATEALLAEIVRAATRGDVLHALRELRRIAGEAAHDDHEPVALERTARQLALVGCGAEHFVTLALEAR